MQIPSHHLPEFPAKSQIYLTFALWDISSGFSRQGGYAVASLMARYRINSHWDVQLNANNLFDRTYYTRLGGTNTYNTYGDPRNFQLTLRAQF